MHRVHNPRSLEFLPFAIGGALAAVVCWRPLGLVRDPGVRRALRSFAIAFGVAPTAVTSPGLFIGFVIPAALQLTQGLREGSARDIAGGAWPIVLGTLLVWAVWTASARAFPGARDQSPRR